MPSRAARTNKTLAQSEADLAGVFPEGADGFVAGNQGFTGDEEPVEVALDGQPETVDADGATFTEAGDGGMVIDFAPNINRGAEPEFDANLAEFVDESELNKIAEEVIESVGADKESRAEWESMMSKGIEQLGLKIEDREWPFRGASGIYDTLMMEAVTRDHAVTVAELLPAGGPVKTQIIGQANEQLEAQAARVKEWFNFYLTEGAPEYYDDRDQMFFWRALVGSTFTKTYQDPILGRPVSPFITPDNFVVSFTTSHLNTSPRYTHIIPMNVREMRLRQISEFYRDIDLGDPQPVNLEEQASTDPIRRAILTTEGRQSTDYERDALFNVNEQHVDMVLNEFPHKDSRGKETGLPQPYIVTVDKDTRQVLSIRRNWRQNDPTCRKIQYFTHYKFLPGLGFYGYGYAHILGNPAKAATSLQRQIIDAATLNMFPGGLTSAQLKTGDNNINIGPCEFRYIETGGQAIQSAVMPMPYKDVSPVTLDLLNQIRENSKNLANAQEIAVGEGRQDAPVGTTVALLEAATRVASANIKRAHRAMRHEFKLFGALFSQYLPESPYPYQVQGGKVPMRSDFSNRVDIIPVSDPNITSSAQRMMRAEALMRLGSAAPDLYDRYNLNRNMLVEMNVDEMKINRVLPPPAQAVATDALSENQMVLGGKPITTAEYQDHEAHIAVHMVLEQVPAMQGHIAEHIGQKMRVKVQQILGQPLPPLGQKMPPEVENKISMLVAQAMQQLNLESGSDLTPEKIAMEEIKVQAQKVMADIANSKRDQETKAFESQIRRRTELDKMESQERIAEMRSRTELAKAGKQRKKETQ